MEIRTLTEDQLDIIKPLWEQLNSLHEQLSTNFKAHHKTFTFPKRMKAVLSKEHRQIFSAFEKNIPIGYCIASANAGCGEIDSLFVVPEYRSGGIGGELLQKALEWLEEQRCNTITVLVAEGNEHTIPFYERFGFKPKATLLKMASVSYHTTHRHQKEVSHE